MHTTDWPRPPIKPEDLPKIRELLTVEKYNRLLRHIMSTRIWTDPSGRDWKVSRYDLNSTMSADPWPEYTPPANQGTLRIRFTDPDDPTIRESAVFTTGKPVAQLSEEEIAGYWEEVVAAHPEFATTPTPE